MGPLSIILFVHVYAPQKYTKKKLPPLVKATFPSSLPTDYTWLLGENQRGEQEALFNAVLGLLGAAHFSVFSAGWS